MVREQINNLSENVAPGPDKLISKVLKTNCDQILEPLTKILQTSFLTGRLPKLWRQAIVTPIFKKGDKLDVSNYRPISLTCLVCKLSTGKNNNSLFASAFS
jgi:hypothetical protein